MVFALLGVAVGVQLLLKPGPFNAKLIGLAFAAVLVALGVVRVRMYLKIKRELAP
jgi:uncharacterized membrane protein HdeD (DUF308 family)